MIDQRRQRGLAIAAYVLAALALLAPVMAQTTVLERVGVLMAVAALLEIAQGFRRTTHESQRAAWLEGGITLGMGVLLVNAPWLAGGALIIFLAGWFGLDAGRRGLEAVRRLAAGRPASTEIAGAIGNLAVAVVLLVLGDRAAGWAAALAGAFRIASTAAGLAAAPVFIAADSGRMVVTDFGLPDQPQLRDLVGSLETQEAQRAPADRSWIAAFGFTLFAIHLGRTGLDRSALGIMTPAVAVFGDFVVALIAAFAIVVPLRITWRKLTRRMERRLWSWWLDTPDQQADWRHRGVSAVLTFRLRDAIRLRQARYSLPTAVNRGLQIGLPVAAIIAATAPVFGMSWYFDTENWAAGIWNNWAEVRTDTWREAMIAAEHRVAGDDITFALEPPGVAADTDFSFIVIGDTGEGDASQHVLKDRYLNVVQQDDVRFVVLSSDVVYPVGAMRDYEAKFWLPFKGTHKPVYAIPGNHDWYDALEAFNATFLTPAAARAAMRARIEVDNGLTTTTGERIDQMIAQAARLQREYQVPTQFQAAPFFQVQTDRFALIAVDTGVARTVDAREWAWLERALEAARGKLVMVILGHPFYAGGHDTVGASKSFGALRTLLREHGVGIVMAGDTHDLEYYLEDTGGSGRPVHHFVNGGGGAYMSFGTALSWPREPATREWAYYPTTAQVVAKIDATTPWWKWPVWWWTRQFNAWPYSAEWLSAMFDINAAPFFQSFVEVKVEPGLDRVRLIPHGIHGRLRWSDLQRSGAIGPPGSAPEDFAEWTVSLPR